MGWDAGLKVAKSAKSLAMALVTSSGVAVRGLAEVGLRKAGVTVASSVPKCSTETGSSVVEVVEVVAARTRVE